MKMFFQFFFIICIYSEDLKTTDSKINPAATNKNEKTNVKKEAYEETYIDPETGKTSTHKVRNTFNVGKIPSLEINPPPNTISPANGNKGKTAFKPKEPLKKAGLSNSDNTKNNEKSSEGELPNFDELNKLMEGLVK